MMSDLKKDLRVCLKKFYGFLLVSAVFSTAALGNIFEKIDECEANGGGSCIYTIMRDLAANQGGATGPANIKFYATKDCNQFNEEATQRRVVRDETRDYYANICDNAIGVPNFWPHSFRISGTSNCTDMNPFKPSSHAASCAYKLFRILSN